MEVLQTVQKSGYFSYISITSVTGLTLTISPHHNTHTVLLLSLLVTTNKCLTFTVSLNHNTHVSCFHCLSPEQNTRVLNLLSLPVTTDTCLTSLSLPITILIYFTYTRLSPSKHMCFIIIVSLNHKTHLSTHKRFTFSVSLLYNTHGTDINCHWMKNIVNIVNKNIRF